MAEPFRSIDPVKVSVDEVTGVVGVVIDGVLEEFEQALTPRVRAARTENRSTQRMVETFMVVPSTLGSYS
jgi:hypothetical protein